MAESWRVITGGFPFLVERHTPSKKGTIDTMKGTIATPTVHMREHRVERAYFTLRAGFATRAAPQTHSARTREPPRTLLQRSPYRGGAPVPQADLRPPMVLRGFSARCPKPCTRAPRPAPRRSSGALALHAAPRARSVCRWSPHSGCGHDRRPGVLTSSPPACRRPTPSGPHHPRLT